MAPAGQIVLLVDDDRTMRRASEGILRHGGYSPIVASDPLEALKKSREFTGEIHLLLTDVVMPGMDGVALAQQILAERPHIRILLMSAYANVSSRLPLLRKPFRMDQLLEQVGKVIGSAPPLPCDVFGDRERSSDNRQTGLVLEVNQAARRYLESSRNLLEITQDTPSGIPYPDNVKRIERAASERKRKFEEYQEARKRLDEHVAERRVEPDKDR